MTLPGTFAWDLAKTAVYLYTFRRVTVPKKESLIITTGVTLREIKPGTQIKSWPPGVGTNEGNKLYGGVENAERVILFLLCFILELRREI